MTKTRIVIIVVVVVVAAFVLATIIACCCGSKDGSASAGSAKPPASDSTPEHKEITKLTGMAADISTAADGAVRAKKAGVDTKFHVVVVVTEKKKSRKPAPKEESWKVQSAKEHYEAMDRAAFKAEQNIDKCALSYGKKSYTADVARRQAKEARELADKAWDDYQEVLHGE